MFPYTLALVTSTTIACPTNILLTPTKHNRHVHDLLCLRRDVEFSPAATASIDEWFESLVPRAAAECAIGVVEFAEVSAVAHGEVTSLGCVEGSVADPC